MGDPNDGIRWLLQCGISYLFDPDIEGAAKDSCTHRLLLFSHLPLNHEERRARGRVNDMPYPSWHLTRVGLRRQRRPWGSRTPRSSRTFLETSHEPRLS